LKYILEWWLERFRYGDAKSWPKRVSLLRQNLGGQDGTYRTGIRPDKNMLVRLREVWVDELKFG
jgi:hypothetical protein